MKKTSLFAVLLLNLAYCNLAYCEQGIDIQYSQSPPRTAEEEVILRSTVGWQTGCTIPDLSKSAQAGSATLKLFLNKYGSPKKNRN
jgi:hypothetical protein